MSDFIVRFQGVELTKEHAQQVQSAIQRTVLTELSGSSLAAFTPNLEGPETSGVATFLPVHWRGIIIIVQDTLRSNPEVLDKKLTVHAE